MIIESSPNNNLITKSNILIEANYKLTVTEQKIILYLVSKIRQEDTDFHMYTLPIKTFYELLGYTGYPKYSEMKKITKDLMSKVLEIREEKKLKQLSWLSYVEYNENEGSVNLSFDPRLKPYLLELKREFTSYKLKNVMELKSGYSIRIFEVLKKWQGIKQVKIDLDTLRKQVGADNKYIEYHNFKKKVLNVAFKEINEKTDINFRFTEIKKGRKVQALNFFISSKSNLEILNKEQKEDLKESVTLNNYSSAKKLILKLGAKLNQHTYRKWINEFGENNVLRVVDEMQMKKNIENPIGYITYMLRENTQTSNDNASVDQEKVLLSLVQKFKSAKEILPNWYVEEESLKFIEKEYNLGIDKTSNLFSELKIELFEALGLKDNFDVTTLTLSEEEFELEKKKLKQELQKEKGES